MSAAGLPSVRTRILVADSAELLRRGIRDVLARNRRFSVVGEIAELEGIAQAYLDLAPDLLFLGTTWPGDACVASSAGLSALRRLLRVDPFARAIVLVESDGVDGVLAAARAGARGVFLRDAPATMLLEAVPHALTGGSVLDPRLTRNLFDHLAQSPEAAVGMDMGRQLNTAALRALSPREQEVLRSLAQGRRNKEIARELGVSVGTVKTHLRHIFRKLRVYDRTTAVLTVLQTPYAEAA